MPEHAKVVVKGPTSPKTHTETIDAPESNTEAAVIDTVIDTDNPYGLQPGEHAVYQVGNQMKTADGIVVGSAKKPKTRKETILDSPMSSAKVSRKRVEDAEDDEG